MRLNWQTLIGKALIVASWLLFAQIVWVGVQAGIEAGAEGSAGDPARVETRG